MVSVFAILIVSCGRSSSPTPPPEPPPPPATKLQISATAPTKVWFGDPASGSVTTNLPATITANPGIVTGGSYTVSSVTGQTPVKLSASGSGQTAETTVVADCWSQKFSLLSKNGKWNGTTINIGNGIPSAWLYGVTFRTDLKSVVTPVGGVDGVPSPFNFDEGNMLLTFSAKTWNVVTLTETDLVLSRINADNELVVTSYRH